MSISVNMNSTSEILRERGLEQNGSAQKWLDKEVVRKCDPYVPMRTGTLKKAIGTVYGSGKVVYNTPYARQQYYFGRQNGSQETSQGGLRGRLWFERMKAAHKKELLDGLRRMTGGR